MTDAEQVRAADPRKRLGVGAVLVLVLVAFAITVVIGIVRSSSTPTAVVTDGPPGAAAADDGVVAEGASYVDVAGAVAAPGLYRLPAGARVVDAVAAAGGFLPEAYRAAVNLARPVSDGEQIVIPVAGEEATTPVAADDGVVDLNTADAAELDTLPGIGPALAERIISWRTDNGRFASVDDLLSVPGIGEKLVAGMRDLVRV